MTERLFRTEDIEKVLITQPLIVQQTHWQSGPGMITYRGIPFIVPEGCAIRNYVRRRKDGGYTETITVRPLQKRRRV